jgi:hypothetical protein
MRGSFRFHISQVRFSGSSGSSAGKTSIAVTYSSRSATLSIHETIGHGVENILETKLVEKSDKCEQIHTVENYPHGRKQLGENITMLASYVPAICTAQWPWPYPQSKIRLGYCMGGKNILPSNKSCSIWWWTSSRSSSSWIAISTIRPRKSAARGFSRRQRWKVGTSNLINRHVVNTVVD